MWGWETGTGTRFAIVLDMWGREGVEGTGLGVKEGELKPVSRASETGVLRGCALRGFEGKGFVLTEVRALDGDRLLGRFRRLIYGCSRIRSIRLMIIRRWLRCIRGSKEDLSRVGSLQRRWRG